MSHWKEIVALAAPLALLALPAPTLAADTGGCTTTTVTGTTVDGSSLWSTVPKNSGVPGNTPCQVEQFAWNNFLYLTTDDGGHPRFMSFAPWYDVVPASGSPVWKGSYQPLTTTELDKSVNQEQAGDGFQLLDVAGRTVAYDMRVNQVFFDYVNSNGLYTKAALVKQAAAFQAAPSKKGIWLPPNSSDDGSSIEVKTAWRSFGSDGGCPSSIMYCEKDDGGNEWGLVGFHLVQKTSDHGEAIWATFEHVANAPDCASGGSNPIAQNPADPGDVTQQINANSGITSVESQTGWSFFNYTGYKSAGGDGSSCSYPTATTSSALCLTDPNPSGDGTTWVPVNVCRTDQLPTADQASCAQNQEDAGAQASCLNQSVVSGRSDVWRYYLLAGAEYVIWGATGGGAPTVGCWSFEDGSHSLNCPGASGSGESKLSVGRTGSTSLANTTLETWMQKSMELKAASGHTYGEQDCFSCHQPTTTTWGQGDMSHLFDRISQEGSSGK